MYGGLLRTKLLERCSSNDIERIECINGLHAIVNASSFRAVSKFIKEAVAALKM